LDAASEVSFVERGIGFLELGGWQVLDLQWWALTLDLRAI